MSSKIYYVYILTNKRKTVLYIGVTGNLQTRIHQHKNKTFKGFTSRYNVNQLVYYEEYFDPNDAIAREKALKNLLRKKKEILINEFNPSWRDLSDGVLSA